MYVRYMVVSVVALCSLTILIAEDKQIAATDLQAKTQKTVAAPAKKNGQLSANVAVGQPDIVIGICDLLNSMGTAADGKEKQEEMDRLQKSKTAYLEQQQQIGVKKLEAFNAKKDTLSKEAREKEEQELIALSRDLQNEVQKAQESVRHELNKATEELARAAEQAALEVAKEENLDLLIEKNTGRVIYSKDNYDLTLRVSDKMNDQRKVRLAQNNKKQPANAVTVAEPHSISPQKEAPKAVTASASSTKTDKVA